MNAVIEGLKDICSSYLLQAAVIIARFLLLMVLSMSRGRGEGAGAGLIFICYTPLYMYVVYIVQGVPISLVNQLLMKEICTYTYTMRSIFNPTFLRLNHNFLQNVRPFTQRHYSVSPCLLSGLLDTFSFIISQCFPIIKVWRPCEACWLRRIMLPISRYNLPSLYFLY